MMAPRSQNRMRLSGKSRGRGLQIALGKGQYEDCSRLSYIRARDAYGPAVLFHNVLRQPEAQACARFLFGCEEWFEDLLLLPDRYPHSVVGDGDLQCRAVMRVPGPPHADVQGAFRIRDRVQGVRDQV